MSVSEWSEFERDRSELRELSRGGGEYWWTVSCTATATAINNCRVESLSRVPEAARSSTVEQEKRAAVKERNG